jgi:nicotinate phosphoribosyltransferase
VTGSGAPAAGMVYKLVARRNDAGEWIPVAKTSPGKVSVGGRKNAVRRLDSSGTAFEEVVLLGEDPAADEEAHDGSERVLLVPFITDGEADERYLGAAGTERARAHHASIMQELPIEAFRLGRGEAVIPTTYR